MKKGLILACVCFAFGLLTGTIAEARDGFYLTARGGRTWMNLNNSEDAVSQKADLAFNSVMMYSGALGYKYKYFRGEIEYVSRDNSEKDKYSETSGLWSSTSELSANCNKASKVVGIKAGTLSCTNSSISSSEIVAALVSSSVFSFIFAHKKTS